MAAGDLERSCMRTDRLLCLAAILGMAACGGGACDTNDTLTINGQLLGWSSGAGSRIAASVNATANQVATSPIDAAGKFALTAACGSVTPLLSPAATALGAAAEQIGCPTLSASAPNLGVLGFTVTTDGKQTSAARQTQTADCPGFPFLCELVGFYFYADGDLSGQGQQSCEYEGMGSASIQFNLNITAGWNTMTIDFQSENASPTESYSILQSQALPSTLPWCEPGDCSYTRTSSRTGVVAPTRPLRVRPPPRGRRPCQPLRRSAVGGDAARAMTDEFGDKRSSAVKPGTTTRD